MSNPPKQKTFGHPNPIFPVKDVAAAIAHYLSVFGFRVCWRAEMFASVFRDDCNIFLSADEQGRPGTWLYIAVNDVDAVFAEWQAAGARVRMTPQNFSWGYEAHLFDRDGNVIRIGSEPREGPLGIWIRDDGSRWQQLPGDEWTRAPEANNTAL